MKFMRYPARGSDGCLEFECYGEVARQLLKSGLILFGHPFLKTKNVSRNPSFHEGYG